MPQTLTIDLPEKASNTLVPAARYKVLWGGRDGAKSWSIARMLLARGIAKPERILCVREVQKSIAESVHKLLCDQIEALGLQSHYDVQQHYIHGRNGTQIAFHGLSGMTATSIKSFEGTTICWVEEAQVVSKRSLDILVPTIRADGSELWFSFNPDMDTDEVYRRFVMNTPSNAIVTKINFSDNPWRSKALDVERERMRLEAPDDYDHIYGGHCRPAVEGAVYFKEVSALRATKRLCNIPYDPLLKVHRIWDLGWNDFMSILLVQRQASEIRVIRYIEDRQRTYADYIGELTALGYNWGRDWLPHDGRAKSSESGRSPQMILEQLGCKVEIVDDIGLENGIKSLRQLFPRLYIDEQNAGQLLNRLGRYRRRVSKETGTATTPIHDDESHGADGARYLSIVADQLSNDSDSVMDDPYAGFRRVG